MSNAFFIYRPTLESILRNLSFVQKGIREKPILIISANTNNKLYSELGITPKDLVDLGAQVVVILISPSHAVIVSRKHGRIELKIRDIKVRQNINSTNAFIAFLLYYMFKGEDLLYSMKKALIASSIKSIKSLPYMFPLLDEVEKAGLEVIELREK